MNKRLISGCAKLGLQLTEQQLSQCLDYLQLLLKWNRHYNLTSVRDLNEMVDKHLLDSLSIVEHIKAHRILDVGSGAGLPGIPLAIMFPTADIELIDNTQKKIHFLRVCVQSLGLKNVKVTYNSVEEYVPQQCFELIVTRAFSSLETIVSKCSHLCCNDGYIFAMKGKYPEQELQALGEKQYEVAALTVPGLDAERHLVKIGC